MTFLFAAFFTVFSSKFTSVTKVCQRIQSLIDNKNNIAAAAAVTTLLSAWLLFRFCRGARGRRYASPGGIYYGT